MKKFHHELRQNTAACRIQFQWLGNKKTLNTHQKKQAAETFDADHSFLSASHKLMDSKHPAIQKLTILKGEITAYWKTKTLPFTEDGIRLLPKVHIDDFNTQMKNYRDILQEYVQELQNNLYDIKEEAKNRLGSLFNSQDYPDSVLNSFSVAWDFPSVEPPDYLLKIAPQVYEQMKEQVVAKFQQAVTLAETTFLAEFHQMIEHLHECLQPNPDGTKKVFRDSAVKNLEEFFTRFKELNIGSNDELEKVIHQAEELVNGIKPKDLRTSELLKDDISKGLTNIKKALEPMVTNLPRRKILKAYPQQPQPEKIAS
jgi:hypothetical protein